MNSRMGIALSVFSGHYERPYSVLSMKAPFAVPTGLGAFHFATIA